MRPAQGWGIFYVINIGGGSAGKDLRGRGEHRGKQIRRADGRREILLEWCVVHDTVWRITLGQYCVKRSLSEVETSFEVELRGFFFRYGLRSEKNQNFQGYEGFEIARTDINRRSKAIFMKSRAKVELTGIQRSSVKDFHHEFA